MKAILTAHGTLFQLTAGTGGYSFSYSDLDGAAGGATGPLVPTVAGGGQEISAVGRSFRYYRTADGTSLTWVPTQGARGPAPGVGVEASDSATSLADIAGTYKVLGQRCSASTFSCAPVAATARIVTDGTLRLCIGTEFSDSCPSGVSRTLKPATSNPTSAWTLGSGSSGENLIASKTRGTIAFAYREVHLDANLQPVSTDNLAFFGQRDGVTASFAPSGNMLSFDVNGQLKSTVPDAAGWAAGAGKPLQGFFQDGAGNTYLQSTTGQLATWTVGSGLQIYSKP